MRKKKGDWFPTSISADPEFWKKVKIAASKLDMTASEFVEKALTEYMDSHLFYIAEAVHEGFGAGGGGETQAAIKKEGSDS